MDKIFEVKSTHAIADFWGVDEKILENTAYIKHIFKYAIELSGAKFVSLQEKKIFSNWIHSSLAVRGQPHVNSYGS